MKIDIVLAGVGGQGILSIAATIGLAAVAKGLHLKQSEVHGMSQQGGEVQSHLRLSEKPIASDLIPEGKADLIISVEPMEGLRYLPMLKPDGWLVTNSKPFKNIPNYPDIAALKSEIKAWKNHICVDAEDIAKKNGSARAANIVVLGAASPFLEILDVEQIRGAIRAIFGRKGEKIVNMNLDALEAGRKLAVANQ